MTVQVTQPKFLIATASTVNTTSPRQTITVYAADANGTSHYTNENVVVTLASSSTTVGTTDSSVVTIIAGTYYTQAAKFIPGSVGTTQLTASDARLNSYKYSSGTQNVAVTLPALSNNWNGATLGIGQYQAVNAYTPDYVASNLTVNLAHSAAASSSPASTTVLSGNNASPGIILVGVSAGIDTLSASATGYSSTAGQVTVTQGHSDPIVNFPSSLSLAGTDSVYVTLYSRATSSGTQHPVVSSTTFNISGNSHVMFYTTPGSPITSVTIPAGNSYVQFWVKGTSTGTDSAITFTSANYATQSLSLTVSP
jgi:hypothetical protein